MNAFLLRNDLRLNDNTALIHCINDSFKKKEEFIFIFDISGYEKTKRDDYFLSAFNKFYNKLKELNLDIFFIKDTKDILDLNIKSLYLNRVERGKKEKEERELIQFLNRNQIKVYSYFDKHLHPAEDILKKDQTPYKVFTSYYNKWTSFTKSMPVDIDIELLKKTGTKNAKNIYLKEYRNLIENVAKNFEDCSGEEYALDVLKDFISEHLKYYKEDRDIPYLEATSQLSKFLRTGEISIRTVYHLIKKEENEGAKTFIKQLCWRDFYNMVYHYNKDEKELEIIEKYRNLHWENDKDLFELWKSGHTGYPIVDAGMRQLKEEGIIHNRVRMIVASFLVKDLLIDWRWGEEYFSTMLMDYDDASNIGSWQWCASVGTDASPYFRVFNPALQSKKFDKNAYYIKKYLPELKNISSKYIHEPFKYKKKIKELYDIDIEKIYSKPIVDHKVQRIKAIEMFKKLSL